MRGRGTGSLPCPRGVEVCGAERQAGEGVPYLFLARVFGTVEDEPKRLRITELMANAFRTVLAVSPQDLLPVVRQHGESAALVVSRLTPPQPWTHHPSPGHATPGRLVQPGSPVALSLGTSR